MIAQIVVYEVCDLVDLVQIVFFAHLRIVARASEQILSGAGISLDDGSSDFGGVRVLHDD